MLINTLFLFLREGLPLFLLCALLAALIGPARPRGRVIKSGLIAGLCGYLLLRPMVDVLSQSIDGAGLELCFFAVSTLQVLLLIAAFAWAGRSDSKLTYLALGAILALFTAVSLLNFMTYFISLWSQQALNQALVLGAIIGSGLSVSISVLLYFMLCGLRPAWPLLTPILLAIFFSAKFSAAVNLLAQVGLVESEVVWSTQHWLPDQSALALVLSGLLGYESTPSDWQLLTYVLSILVLSGIVIFRRKTLVVALQHSEEQR